jgi:hypothetical protein
MNLDDYCSGGYFLMRSGRPDWKSPWGAHLPEGNLISLSTCICRDRLSVSWGWTPGNLEAALRFGIVESRIEEFVTWSRDDFLKSVGYDGMFHSVDAARNFARRFEIDRRDLFIIGAALPRLLHELWTGEASDAAGIDKRIQACLVVEPGGVVLGYDIVSFRYGDFGHSWLCSGLDKDMHELYGIRANHHGLLATYEDAKQVNDWIAEDDCKGQRAEPEPYDFWLLMSYPLE